MCFHFRLLYSYTTIQCQFICPPNHWSHEKRYSQNPKKSQQVQNCFIIHTVNSVHSAIDTILNNTRTRIYSPNNLHRITYCQSTEIINFAGESGNRNIFLNSKRHVQKENWHWLPWSQTNALDPPYFLLPTTFKEIYFLCVTPLCEKPQLQISMKKHKNRS
jgi:hypothetical protein